MFCARTTHLRVGYTPDMPRKATACLPVRVEWFWRTLDTCHVVPNCCRTPIPKFNLEMLLEQGLRKCWLLPKNGPKHFFTRFWSLQKQTFLFFLVQSKKTLCPFWGHKMKYLQILILNFSFDECSFKYIYIFLRSLWFLKMKTFRAFADFLELDSSVPIRYIFMCPFSKMVNHSTLLPVICFSLPGGRYIPFSTSWQNNLLSANKKHASSPPPPPPPPLTPPYPLFYPLPLNLLSTSLFPSHHVLFSVTLYKNFSVLDVFCIR